MQNILLKSILFIFILFFYNGITNSYAQPFPSRTPTYEEFYNELSPHGEWMSYLEYGNVWHPTEDNQFRPYLTDGYWIYTEDGWYFHSDYTWGWIPFHYGRWLHDKEQGWLWIPDYEWAPAWVLWGETEEYICWAPLAPNIDPNNWKPDEYYWNVVAKQYFTDIHLEIYIANRKVREEEIPQINIIYNSSDYAPRGPDVSMISVYKRDTIIPIPLKDIILPQNDDE